MSTDPLHSASRPGRDAAPAVDAKAAAEHPVDAGDLRARRYLDLFEQNLSAIALDGRAQGGMLRH